MVGNIRCGEGEVSSISPGVMWISWGVVEVQCGG